MNGQTLPSVLQEDWAARDYIKSSESAMEELIVFLQRFGTLLERKVKSDIQYIFTFPVDTHARNQIAKLDSKLDKLERLYNFLDARVSRLRSCYGQPQSQYLTLSLPK